MSKKSTFNLDKRIDFNIYLVRTVDIAGRVFINSFPTLRKAKKACEHISLIPTVSYCEVLPNA